jgi:aryl-alcohol dehydrogenase-like predicted oxidoreductase
MTVETIELAPGYRISRMLRGGWQLAGGHGAIEAERAIADMAAFVDAGVTTFDCADIYTGVEEMIGRFRERMLAEQIGRAHV